ncbi:hypothetical protein PFISCL1PPCAC_11086, partial [Pristionchus fissidentatus]
MHAMENIGCKAMIRGHQVMLEGYDVTWKRLFCVFTATCAEDHTNKGAVAIVDENLKVFIRVFQADKTR